MLYVEKFLKINEVSFVSIYLLMIDSEEMLKKKR